MRAPNPRSQSITQVYFVRSSQDPNRFYLIQPDSHGALKCQCKAAQFSKRPCRHVRDVVDGKALVDTPKARTRVATRPQPAGTLTDADLYR